ncbi:MAG TPA: CbiX/SirB N-terminal domain-containing protein [Bryobacteraceae bacterium]|nr:CbiX/SirB N-terminal domain-containing protein [Bryobacteraceae bacterium]
MTGIIVFAHGSTIESANDAVHAVTSQLAHRTGCRVETAFLDCAPPTMADAVARLAGDGVRRVVVLPYFLTLGVHLQRDLPAIVDRLRPIYKGMEFTVSEPLDGHPALLDVLIDRYNGIVGGQAF